MTAIAPPGVSSSVSVADLTAIRESAIAAGNNKAAASSSSTLGGSSSDGLSLGNTGSSGGIANFNSAGTNVASGPVTGDGIDQRIASVAGSKTNGVGKDCYNVTVRVAEALGHKGNGDTWKQNRQFSGQSTAEGVKASVQAGTCKPGNVIYGNNNGIPGRSGMGENPHWATYLGIENGQVMVADNHNQKTTIEKAFSGVGEKLAAIYDPSGTQAGFTPQT
jgi:hypothetical protein